MMHPEVPLQGGTTVDPTRLMPRSIRSYECCQRYLFGETTLALLNPATRALGPLFMSQLQGALLGAPIPFSQSVLLIWPHITRLVAGMILLFTVTYVEFQRQEIRA